MANREQLYHVVRKCMEDVKVDDLLVELLDKQGLEIRDPETNDIADKVQQDIDDAGEAIIARVRQTLIAAIDKTIDPGFAAYFQQQVVDDE